VVGVAVLVAVLFLQSWMKWVALAAAALPLALLAVGQFFLPRSGQKIRLWMNPDVLENLGDVTLRLSGKEVSLGFFKRWYEFKIETFNVWLLAILGLASLGAIAGVWTTQELPMPAYYLYYGGSAWLLVCYLAWRWLWERRVMRKSGFALGSFRVASTEGPLMRRVIYHFVDEKGEYRGGSLKTLFCDTQDELTVIFYDEDDPEISIPASAMMFHRLRWSEAGENPG
jgi:hypothetical protein